MNATEIKVFESITKQVLSSEDALLDIYSVTVTSQGIKSTQTRQRGLAQGTGTGTENDFEVSGFILGKILSFPSNDLGRRLFAVRVNRLLTGDVLHSRLSESIGAFEKEVKDPSQIQENESEVETGPEGEESDFPFVGAGIGAAGGFFLLIAALLVKNKTRRRANVAQFSDPYAEQDIEGIYVVEAETEIESVHNKTAPRNTFEERDNKFSTLSYSDTSSEFVFEQDFPMSLTSSSVASATIMTTRTSTTTRREVKHADPALQLPSNDLLGPNLPVQTLVRSYPFSNQHEGQQNPNNDGKTQEDDTRSANSLVSTDILHTHTNPKKGVGSRMFSCLGDSPKFIRTSFTQSFSGIMTRSDTDRTPTTPARGASHPFGNPTYPINPSPSTISAVSSLSGKSSCTGSISLSGGEPYEVLVPASAPLGLVVKTSPSGPQILRVKPTSPLHNIVQEGDYILSADGVDARYMTARELSQWLHRHEGSGAMGGERTLILMSRLISHGPYGVGNGNGTTCTSDVI